MNKNVTATIPDDAEVVGWKDAVKRGLIKRLMRYSVDTKEITVKQDGKNYIVVFDDFFVFEWLGNRVFGALGIHTEAAAVDLIKRAWAYCEAALKADLETTFREQARQLARLNPVHTEEEWFVLIANKSTTSKTSS